QTQSPFSIPWSHIYCKATVILEGGLKFDLDSIRFLVYNNSASTFPILEETYSSENRQSMVHCEKGECEERLYIEEKFPIFGYKYQLSWAFKQ
ncbi:MAG: hypothetical protein LIO95_01050, partial [Clostridiales bacterium]|nr:hypothetical protein [Clostridiales bacterium]